MDFLQFAMKDDPSERAKREKKAASAECTPLSLDVENKTGTFKGSSGIYETRIDGCPCMDCARRRLPCKHMYRLAAELGLYDIGNVASDVSKVKKTKSEKDSILKKAISLVDGYPESTQREIQIALYHWHNGNPYVADINKINAPVSDGLFVIINDPIFILQSNTQKRTVEGLLDAGFKFPDDLKETKKARYAWCIEHAETACSIVYPDSVVVKVSDSFEPVALRTYTHLNKKFNPDTQSHVDDIVINFRFN